MYRICRGNCGRNVGLMHSEYSKPQVAKPFLWRAKTESEWWTMALKQYCIVR